MATATLPTGATRADARVRADLAQAALRIRVKDAAAGALGLVALVLLYVAVTVTLDKALELSALARGCGLALFALAAGLIAFFGVVRPLRRRVNPRYAARQVERASPGAKNAVINYVDLEDADLAESVRTSLAGRAAEEVAASDARKVSESRLVTGLLVACGLLVAVLAALFLWLKPAPFWSLLTRAFHPTTVATIATRSEITLDTPAAGDATVLAGDSLTVAVTIQGRVPGHREPDRARLLVKYNQDAEPEEVALPPAGSAREFAVLLSPGTVQNGFWYAVAAGDARTPEFRVSVKPRPAILEYDVTYTYPAYTRLKPEAARDPKVVAVRGTEVALTVTANRAVKAGALKLSYQASDVPGELLPDAPDKLRFKFPLTDSGTYTVGFTTAEDEPGDRTPEQRVIATPDAKPAVTISAPATEETALPVAARLAVDGLASDDYGVTNVSLKMQLAGPVPVPLRGVKYRPEKPLKRDADGSFPVVVEAKVSAELAKLKLASNGEPASLAEGAVVEYWLEATDNREPVPNVGKSKIQRVKVAPPAKTPDEAKQQEQAGQRRDGEEQKHAQQQDQQFQNEDRKPAQPRPDQQQANPPKPQGADLAKPQEPKGNDKPQNNDPQGAKPPGGAEPPKGTDPQQGNPQDTKPQNGAKPPESANPKPPEGQTPPMNPPGSDPMGQPNPSGTGNTEPKAGANGTKPPDSTQKSTTGSKEPTAPEQTPAGDTPEQKKVEAEKNAVQQKLNDARGKPSGDPSQGNPANGQRQPTEAERKEIEDAAKKLDSPNEAEQKQAEQTLDNKIGKENRERAQEQAKQLAKDLKDPDPKVSGAAKQKLDDIAKQAGANAKPQPGQQQPDPAAAANAARDLANPDDSKREAAEKSLDRSIGEQARKDLQQQAKDAAADRAAGKPGEADKKLDAAANQARDMAKQAGEKGQPGGTTQQPPKVDPKELEQAAKDLASGDPAKQKAAGDKIDQQFGKGASAAAQKKAEQLKQDLESDDPKRAEKARKEVAGAAKAAGQQPGEPGQKPEDGAKPQGPQGGGQQPDPKAVGEAAKNLASDDPKKREDAAKELNNTLGDKATKDLQKQADEIRQEKQAGGAGAGEKTEQKLNELANKAKEQAAAGGGGKPPEPGQKGDKPQPGQGAGGGTPDPKAVEDAVKKLASGTPAEKEAARKALDQQVGPKAREQTERDAADAQKGLSSDKPGEQAAGQRKLDDTVKRTQDQAAKGQGGKPSAEQPDPKALAEALKNLNSADPATRKKAEDTADKALGKENREAAQAKAKKIDADRKSDDETTRKAAEQDFKDLQAKTREQADDRANADGPQPSPADADKWKQAAKDLAGDDKAKREAAEKEFDKALGEDARRDLQKDLQDLKNGTPEQRKAAQDRLQQKSDRAAKNDARQRGPGGGFEQKGDKLVENARNRLKTAELQLADFEKVKSDPALRGRLGYTDAEYERFLADVRKSVDQQRTEVAKLEAASKAGPTTINLGGGQKVAGTNETGSLGGSGPGTAPPGFAEAQKRFAEEAARRKRAGQK